MAFGVTFVAFVFWLLIVPAMGLLFAYICAINVTALLLYAWDKAIAGMQSGRRITRVPEVVLHSVAFAGGSPMALMAQRIFHHKTCKTKFIMWYYVVVGVQFAILFLWL